MLADAEGLARARYAAEPGTVCLVRPDQHVGARWRGFEADAVRLAAARVLGRAQPAAVTGA